MYTFYKQDSNPKLYEIWKHTHTKKKIYIYTVANNTNEQKKSSYRNPKVNEKK